MSIDAKINLTNISLSKTSKLFTSVSLPLLLLSSSLYAQQSNEKDNDGSSQTEQQKAVPFDPDAPEEATAQPSTAAQASLAMIDKALKNIDNTIEREGNAWQFQIEETQVLVVTDPIAERMRIMVPIIQADSLNNEILSRLLQANFDSALDARYAVANGLLWGTYIHPLTRLDEEQFLSGLGQTISIVQTFGTSFSSGEVVFGGGDSQNIIEEQIEEQEKERKANSLT